MQLFHLCFFDLLRAKTLFEAIKWSGTITKWDAKQSSWTIKSELVATARYEIETLVASGHVSHETLVALHDEFLGHLLTNIMHTGDQTALIHAFIHGPIHSRADDPTEAYNFPSNSVYNFPQSIFKVDESSSRYGAWLLSNTLGSVSRGWLGILNNNVVIDIL
ncbi:unnamed protein product [Vicia faba]|uniref:Uncharacterized protein n=1 Tax=Vicia faba TaxID=3906 RepID=A0AAV0ZBZ1_VICFA|nr:unnamed protein product [Vicia faba]